MANNPPPFWQAAAPAEAERAAGPASRPLAPATPQTTPRPALNLPGVTDVVLAATELLPLDLSNSPSRSQHPGTHFVSSGTVPTAATFDAGTGSTQSPDAGGVAGSTADASAGPSLASPGSVSQDTGNLLALVNFIPLGGGSVGSGNHHDGAPAGPGGNGGGGGDGQTDIKRDPPGGRGRKSNDPLWVLDVNNGLVLTGGETIHDFSGWTVDLYAQVSGASLAATDYHWDTHLAPDATNVTVISGYHLKFTWKTFSCPDNCADDTNQTISITTNPGQSPITQTFYFTVYSQSSPAWSSPTPHPFGTNVFPLLVPPDAVLADQQTIDRQYYSLGEATGEVMTHFTLPSYHPAVAPLQLDYSSLAADPRPIFTEYYQLSQTPTTGSTVTATLKLNGVTQGTSTYDTHLLNFGDILAIALQGDATGTGLSTGRYPYEIDVTENSTAQTPQTGSVDIVNSANSPFGAGWSLDNVEHMWLQGSCTSPTGALVELPGGKSLWFAYLGNFTYATPAGDFSTFRQIGTCGSSPTYTRTLPNGTQITFDANGNQTSINDRIEGRTTAFSWLGAKPVVVTDFLGNPMTLAYNVSGKLASITDPAVDPVTMNHRVTQFGVNAGQLTQITEPDPGYMQTIPTFGYSYDSHNKLLTLTDPDSHQTAFTYSSTSARVSTVTRADNTTESLVPQQATGLVASGDQTATLAVQAGAAYTDPRGKAWFDALDWSGFGHPTELFDPLLDESVMHRNNQGLAWLAEDPLDRATRAMFDYENQGLNQNHGNPVEYVLPDRNTELYTYNDLSEVASFTDANRHTTTMTFRGGPIAACRCPASVTEPPVGSPPTSPVTTISWDDSGFLQSQTDPNGNVYTYHYDGAARVGYLEEPPDVPGPATNPMVTFGYNSENYLTSVTDELSHVTTFMVDNLGRVLGIQLPLPTTPPVTGGYITMTYDPAGNRTSLTDPLSSTDTTTFSYDAMNRLAWREEPGQVFTTFSYYQDGRLKDITDPDTLPDSYHRDRHFTYDDAGRLLTEQWLDNGVSSYTATYGYDAASELTSARDNNSSYTLAYDNRGREISTDNANTPNMPHVVLTSVYDAVGNRTAIEDNLPNNGSISFTYDADNRLTNLAMNVSGATDHPVVTLQYDPGARLTNISRTTSATGNQVNTALTYTQRDLVQSITHTSGTSPNLVTLAAYTYGYDLAQNLQTKSEYDNISQVTLTFAYSYDPLNQLTGVTASNSSYNESYSYTNAQNQDLNGNRSSASFGSTSQTYGAPAADNRLTMDGQYSYTYDNAGNLVNKTGKEAGVTFSYDYTYDFRNRLTEAKKTQVLHGLVAADDTFTYDVFDRRIGKHDVFGTQLWTAYDGDNAYADFSGQTLTTRYIFANGLDELLARTDANGNNTAWYLVDNLGSVRQIVNAAGNNLYHVNSFTFGGIVPGSESGSGGDRFKFAARELDAEIGLYYNRARYYDPNVGRFIQEDPIGFAAGSSNLYTYTGNSPTKGASNN